VIIFVIILVAFFFFAYFLKGGGHLGRMKVVEAMVQSILEDVPATRDDDDLLFCIYLKSLDYDDFSILAEQIITKKMMPKFKSVERARRKLQEKNPALWGTRRAERMEAQKDFRDYARDKNC
jgi:hypothetical protein